MAVVGDGEGANRALTQVRAVDGAYPLVGQVTLDRDPFAAGPDSLLATTITRTLLGGHAVHGA
jgi:predicted lysophospholipase L1 biosynthesis ABC-type transport system permease subunit